MTCSAAPGSLYEALHKRDALLSSMLIANPLRRRNYVLMTYARRRLWKSVSTTRRLAIAF